MKNSTTNDYDVKISKDCISFSVDHISSSYGRFTLTGFGDFILQSDYGYYVTSWPGQKDLISFLTTCNLDYIFKNLERSHNQHQGNGKGIPSFRATHIKILIESFLEYLTEWNLLRFCPSSKNNLNLEAGQIVISSCRRIAYRKISESEWTLFYNDVAKEWYLCQDERPEKVFIVDEDTAEYYQDGF